MRESDSLPGVRIDCHIRERASGKLVPALIRPARQSDKVLWSGWISSMPRGAEDGRWPWDKFIDLALAWPDTFATYALEAAGDLQGLRVLEVSGGVVDQYGTHAMRVSTAPWNRPPNPRFRGVGSLLVGVAILRSIADGHDGYIHCESLPGAEWFHEQKNGMVRFGGLSREGLKRYRFERAGARAFLRRLVSDGLLPPRPSGP